MSEPAFTEAELLPHGVQGLKLFESARGLLGALHSHHANANRTLHYDELALWLLVSYFNPTLASMRALQSASTFERVQQRTGLPRFSLGSFSESARVFDPELLQRVFRGVAEQTQIAVRPEAAGLPPQLRVLLADGSIWKALPRMARHFYNGPLTRCPKGGFKGHFLFDVLRGGPEDVTITASTVSEKRVLATQLAPGVLYVLDRGYVSGQLTGAILEAQASFLLRATESCAFEVEEERPLRAAAIESGVLSDQRVRWQGRSLRRVMARKRIPPPTNLHPRRCNGKHGSAPREGGEQTIVLLTDRWDLSAEDVVLLYTWRWQIELFFRWLKCTLGCRHFFSESENGFALQLYVALIASLLIAQWSERKPSQRLLEAVQLHFAGWASAAEVRRVLERCKAGISQ
jgi:hypothetical protein